MKAYIISNHDGRYTPNVDLVFLKWIDAEQYCFDKKEAFSIQEIEIIEKYVNPKIEKIQNKLTALYAEYNELYNERDIIDVKLTNNKSVTKKVA